MGCTTALLASGVADARASGSNDSWSRLDRWLTDNAIAIPYLNLKTTDFTSRRLGNYQHHPEYGLLIDQVWVR